MDVLDRMDMPAVSQRPIDQCRWVESPTVPCAFYLVDRLTSEFYSVADAVGATFNSGQCRK